MEKKRRSPGSDSLFKRADGQWMGVVELPRLDGKRRQKRVSSRDRNVAIQKLKELRKEIAAGRVEFSSATTVAKWLDRWVDSIRGPKLRPKTKRQYASVIANHINPHIGTKRLDRLTAQHVRDMQSGIPLSRTAQLAHVILQRALDDAIKEGLLSRNVAKVADKPGHVSQDREPLAVDEAMRLIKTSIDAADPMATRWAAALFLGARQGEILGLQWDRVNLEEGIVDFAWQLQHINKSHGCGSRHSDGTWPCGKVRNGYCPQARFDLPRGLAHRELEGSLLLTPPKTKAGTRVVPIPAPLWAMLQIHRNQGNGHNPHNLVWHHDGKPIHPRDDNHAWHEALDRAGLPSVPLHAARNTTATLLLDAGVPEVIYQKILGHVSLAATRKYAKVNVSLAREHMNRALAPLAE